jgi:hypothetical protein
MHLKIDGLQLDIDLDGTMLHQAKEAENPCDCAYCRNFSAAIDGAYPNLRSFLAQFGLDITLADESMPYDQPNQMWYENVYCVCGRILSGDETTVEIDGTEVYFHSEHQINSACPQPRFYITVGMMRLPWVLDEPVADVISPANDPSFLQKMWNRLLTRYGKLKIKS